MDPDASAPGSGPSTEGWTASCELLIAALHHCDAGVAILHGPELRHGLVNPAYERLAPGTPMLGRAFAEVFPEASAAGAAEALRGVLETGVRWRFERFPAPVPDAADAIWEGEAIRLLASPDPPSVAMFVRDVTDRVLAEHALRAAHERLHRLLEANPIGVVHGDEGGRILDANEAYLRILGRTRDELRAGTVRWDVATPPEYLPRDAKAAAEARARGVSALYEKEYVRPDGSRVPVLVACATLGEPGELVAFVADITDRKRSERALRESDRRKSEFLAVLSHELRNPLAPIRNGVYVLERAAPGTPQATRAREVIRRQTDHLAHLVDDLLDVTRISRGKITLERARIDLGEIARRTTEDLRSVSSAAGVELRVERAAGAPVWVDADVTRIAQVLGNLLQNAVKFTPAGGRVTVAVAAAGDQAELRVLDTGAGMDPAALEEMFEPFAQGHQPLARSTGGLGLGLALVRGLVELHGGTVEGRSAGRGHGCEFVVRLPRAAAGAHREGEAGLAAGPGRRVLLVEDNDDAAASLADLLQLHGHEVHVSRDGRGGIALARTLLPDVVICDLGLPDLDGYEVARALRGDPALGSPLIVALSGYALPEDLERSRAAGFDAHLAKPPELERLLAEVARGGARQPAAGP